MIGYYFRLAWSSLRRNVVITALTIAAVALGIATSMTVLTVLLAMSADPIPQKSTQLYAVQIDNWGPDNRDPRGEPGIQLSYTDSNAFMQAKRGTRQTAMYGTSFSVTPADPQLAPFSVEGRAANRDFFAMFAVPFRHGAAWSAADDEGRANVVAISSTLSRKLFGDTNPVGRSVDLDQREYRVVGVLDEWDPQPRYYDVTSGGFHDGPDVFLPFTTAIDREMALSGNNNCNQLPEPGWLGHLHSECVWTQFWVELPTAEAARKYREFLEAYAAEQQRAGRFHWAPLTRLRNVPEWLAFNKVVSDEARLTTLLSFGFLLVCLCNAIGLMLAKFSSRASELSVRRALGASRRDIFLQCMIETGVIGALGGVLGIALTVVGLAAQRAIQPEEIAKLAHLEFGTVALTVGLAVFATLCSGLYPTWRASRVQPAWQLKAQ